MEETVNELRNFVKECNDLFITSDTNLNPKILGNYSLSRQEVYHQVIDWVFHYLENRKCPYNLAVAIAKETAQQINSGISEQQLKENSEQANLLNSIKLYNDTIKKLASVCKSYVEEVNENEIGYFQPRYTASVFAIKNKRRKMEDRHVIHHDLNMLLDLKDMPPHSYYAVFDGHSGVDAASYASANLHINIANHPAFLTDTVTAIAEAYKITDEDFSNKCYDQNLRSGSTAVCALIREKTIYLSWLGDSQAVLVKEGKPVIVTSPHKPERDDERKRIECLGGNIIFLGTLRVNGMLAVTRAIGDTDQKPFISNEPEINVFHMDGTEDFLILACDGLWDGMSPEDVISALYYNLINSAVDEPLDTVAAKLVHQSKLQGSEDNITAVVIFLRDIKDIKENAEKYIPNMSNLRMDFLSLNGEEKFNPEFPSNISISKPNILEFNNSSSTKLQNTANVLNAAGLGDPSLTCSFFNQAGHSYKEHSIYSEKQSSLLHFAPETTALSELPTPPIDDILASEQFHEMCPTNLTQELHSISGKDSSSDTEKSPSNNLPVSFVEKKTFQSPDKSIEGLNPSEAVDIASSVVSNAIETAVKCLSATELNETNHNFSTTKLNPFAEPFVMKSFTPDAFEAEKVLLSTEHSSPDILKADVDKDPEELVTLDQESFSPNVAEESVSLTLEHPNVQTTDLNKELIADSLHQETSDVSCSDIPNVDINSVESTIVQQNVTEYNLVETDSVISSSVPQMQETLDNLHQEMSIISLPVVDNSEESTFQQKISENNLVETDSAVISSVPQMCDEVSNSVNLNDFPSELIGTSDTDKKVTECTSEKAICDFNDQYIVDNLTNQNLNTNNAESVSKNKSACFTSEEVLVQDMNIYNSMLDKNDPSSCNSNLKIENLNLEVSSGDKITDTCILNPEKIDIPYDTNISSCFETKIQKVDSSSLLVETSTISETQFLSNLPKDEKLVDFNSSDLASKDNSVTECLFNALSNSDKVLNQFNSLENDGIETSTSDIDKITSSLLVETSALSETNKEGLLSFSETNSDEIPAISQVNQNEILSTSNTLLNLITNSQAENSGEIKDTSVPLENIITGNIILENVSLNIESEKLSTAAVLPSDHIDECHVDEVAVDLQTIPVGVPEAEGVTEDIDSDSEKDGGWSYMKGNTVGGAKQKQAASTSAKSDVKSDSSKIKKEVTKNSLDVKSKIRNIASFDKSKKTLPEKKPVDIKAKQTKPSSLTTAKSASDKTSKGPISGVKKETVVNKASTLTTTKTLKTTVSSSRNVPAQVKSSNLPSTSRIQTSSTAKSTLTNVKAKPLNLFKPTSNFTTSTPLPKKQPSTQSTKSNLVSAATRTTTNRPVASTVPTRALSSTKPLQKPAVSEARPKPVSATVKRTIPSTLKSSNVKETKEQANKQISDKKNTIPKASSRGLASSGVANTLKSTLPVGNKPKPNLRSIPLKKEVPKTQISQSAAKNIAPSKLIKKATTLKSSLPSENKGKEKNPSNVEKDIKKVEIATLSEEEKLLREVTDKEIPVKELIEVAASTSGDQIPVENGCTAKKDIEKCEDEAVLKPTESLL